MIMQTCLVSIVIASYNHEKYIKDCIESCLFQSYKNIEIIIIDDMSTDNTYKIAKSIKDKRLIVRQSGKNCGEFGAKNKAIRISKGKYIVYLDSDDMLTENSVEERMKHFLRIPEIDVVCGDVLVFNGDSNLKWCQKYQKEMKKYPNEIADQGIMLKRGVFKKYGLFYTPCYYRGDREYWIRIGLYPTKHEVKNRIPVKYLKTKYPVAYYRRIRNSNSDKMKKDLMEHELLKIRLEQLKKYGITKENTEFL